MCIRDRIGEPRSTVDVDIAVALSADRLPQLLERVRPSFYVPDVAAARAVSEKESFNIIHNEEAMKVDLFVLGDGVLDANQLSRRVQFALPTEPPAMVWITSPEDQVLRKLDWYRQSGQVSDRQMRDVIAILNINGDSLDMTYLTKTAELVGLSQLLDRAKQAANL